MKAIRNQTIYQESYKRDKYLGCPTRNKLGTILEVNQKRIGKIDQRTRKFMTMHKALHPREDVDRLYLSRRGGGRELVSIEVSVDVSIQRIEDYIEKRGGIVIKAIRNNIDNMRINRTKNNPEFVPENEMHKLL